MTVRRQIGLVLIVAALWLVAGCGGRDAPPTAVEMDEPDYRHGEQLKRQGRRQEALAAFLKVIEKRGAQSSAESHLEAGLIYLDHSKDPIEAYHHFRQYLAQQPNSRGAPGVKELINTAKLEILRTMPAQPQENQASLELRERVEPLRRWSARHVPPPTANRRPSAPCCRLPLPSFRPRNRRRSLPLPSNLRRVHRCKPRLRGPHPPVRGRLRPGRRRPPPPAGGISSWRRILSTPSP
jgi:hypothetical protein